MNIHEHIAEQVDLAKIYAEDGAFRTASMKFRKLADDIDAHIEGVEKQMGFAPPRLSVVKNCRHLSHTPTGICNGCGEQHQPL